jgi:hypothetical protein
MCFVMLMRQLMDNVLVNETQLDGFKCDGTDPYILLLDLKVV